jgi:hypothetical protein
VDRLCYWEAVAKKGVRREWYASLGFNKLGIKIIDYTMHHLNLSSPAPPSPNLEVALEMKTDSVNGYIQHGQNSPFSS